MFAQILITPQNGMNKKGILRLTEIKGFHPNTCWILFMVFI